MKDVGEWTRQLSRAVTTLAADQGRIARRNARQRVREAARGLLAAMDHEYPAIKLPAKPRRANRTLTERWRELIKGGWVLVMNPALAGVVGELKLPVRSLPEGEIVQRNRPVFTQATTWVPGWVAHYYPNKSQLFVARKNATMIQAANAAIRLGSLDGKIKLKEIACPTL